MASPDVSCLRIALISERRSDCLKRGYSEEDCAALTHEGEVEAVMTTLQSLGHSVTLVGGIEPLIQKLAAGGERDWDLVFNMAQGLHGSAREAQVPALLEAYRIPYTFSDAATMALCQNKAATKIILQHYGIPSAPFVTIPGDEQSINALELTASLKTYPLFVKPVTEGSSKGIDLSSKVQNSAELEEAVQRLMRKFPGQNMLVETFLPGREFTVSILGMGRCSRVVGIREHIWGKSPLSSHDGEVCPSTDEFATVESKTANGSSLNVHDYDLHDIIDPQLSAASLVALGAWNVFRCRDAGRVDVRFNGHGPDSVPNVLEVNPIGGLLPSHSPLPKSAQKNGVSFEELLKSIIQSALQRKNEMVEH